MQAPRPSLRETFALAGAVALALAAAWPFLAHPYNAGVARIVELVAPDGLSLRAVRMTIVIGGPPGTAEVPGLPLHLALVLAIALAAATPHRAVAWRARLAAAAAALVVASHVAVVWYFARFLAHGGPLSPEAVMGAYWSIVPGGAMVLWCYLFWLPRRSAPGPPFA